MEDRNTAEQIEKILSSNAAKAFSSAYRRFSEDFDAKTLGALVASFLPTDTASPSAGSTTPEGSTVETNHGTSGSSAEPTSAPTPTRTNPQDDWYRIMDSAPSDLLNLLRQIEQYSKLVEVAKLATNVADKFSPSEKKTVSTVAPQAPPVPPAASASYVGEAYLAGMKAGEQSGVEKERARIVTELEEARRVRRENSKYVLPKHEEKLWRKTLRIARGEN